jgi:hypothetical protein
MAGPRRDLVDNHYGRVELSGSTLPRLHLGGVQQGSEALRTSSYKIPQTSLLNHATQPLVNATAEPSSDIPENEENVEHSTSIKNQPNKKISEQCPVILKINLSTSCEPMGKDGIKSTLPLNTASHNLAMVTGLNQGEVPGKPPLDTIPRINSGKLKIQDTEVLTNLESHSQGSSDNKSGKDAIENKITVDLKTPTCAMSLNKVEIVHTTTPPLIQGNTSGTLTSGHLLNTTFPAVASTLLPPSTVPALEGSLTLTMALPSAQRPGKPEVQII